MGQIKIQPLDETKRTPFKNLPNRSFFVSGPLVNKSKQDRLFFKVDNETFFGVDGPHEVDIGPNLQSWTIWEVDVKINYAFVDSK